MTRRFFLKIENYLFSLLKNKAVVRWNNMICKYWRDRANHLSESLGDKKLSQSQRAEFILESVY